MDKIAANNFFTKLRKEIKKAKAMVGGHHVRKIKELNKEKEKAESDEHAAKIEVRVKQKYDELKKIKELDWYDIAKSVTLEPNFDTHWTKSVANVKLSAEERLKARVILKNNIKKHVQEFQAERPDYSEWINEYLEYREKKKDIIGIHTKKGNNRQQYQQSITAKKKPTNQQRKSYSAAQRRPNSDQKSKPSRESQNSMKNNDNTAHKHIAKNVQKQNDDSLHPSWESKLKQKELIKDALAGRTKDAPKRIVFENST